MKTVMLSGLVVTVLALGLVIGCVGGGDSYGWDELSYSERDEICDDFALKGSPFSPGLREFIVRGLDTELPGTDEMYRACMECGPLRVSCDTRDCDCK